MRFINFLVGIVLPLAALTGWLWYGYQKSNEANRASGLEQVTFDQYVMAQARDFVSNDPLTGAEVTVLEDMFPRSPEGWKARKIKESDGNWLYVKGLDEKRQALLLDPALEDYADEIIQARKVWETPDGLVIAELVRYPDSLYTSGSAQLNANLAPFGKIGHAPLLNIAGLEISEAKLLPQIPARALRADLEGQVALRVTTPKAMSDERLRGFFATLNVAAMNAQLAAPIAGMGDLMSGGDPLAVLVDQVTEADRATLAAAGEAFAAERARIRADREAALIVTSKEESAAEGQPASDAGVAVRRGVKQDDPGRSSIQTSGGKTGGFRNDCTQVGGRKVCGVAAPQTE